MALLDDIHEYAMYWHHFHGRLGGICSFSWAAFVVWQGWRLGFA
jgi:hypothetical protein